MNSKGSAPATLTRSLGARYYTDPAIYAREQRGLFARAWQFACHVCAVAEPGDYLSIEIAGQSLFCVRGADQQVRCFYNVCQHRAHELVSGGGHCKLLVCPYHAWTYELDGRLRGGPNIAAVPGFKREDIRLAEVNVEIFCGFVFVNLEPDAKPMDEWFPQVRGQLREFVPQIDALVPVHWLQIAERCNWKVSVENYSECYHCQLNHPTFATGVVKPGTYNIQPQGHCLRHTTQCQNLDNMSYPINLEANARAGQYSSWFLWPMFSFQVYPGNVLNTYVWRPMGPDQVTVYRGWYTVDGQPSTVIDQLAQQDLDTTMQEDVRLVESVQRGLSNRGYQPGPLVIDPDGGVESEHSIKALQQWMREAVAES